MCTRRCLEKIAPTKFMWKYSLRKGSFIIGIIMLLVMIICFFAMCAQCSYTAKKTIEKDSDDKYKIGALANRNSYAFSVIATFYTLFLIILCIMFIVAVKKGKTTTIFAWLVVMAIWLGQTICLVLILIYLHSLETNFIAWLLGLIFAIICLCILGYFLLVVVGFYFQLQNAKRLQAQTT